MPVHIVQRGHSREPVFFKTEDYLSYLGWLHEASERYRCKIHAYVLMTNHIHVLATPEKNNSISLMMQYVGRHYVPYINDSYGTSGSIWEGRYKSNMIHDEAYLLICMRYIELNPVRANMVDAPGIYRWSSYQANAHGKEDELVRNHPLYISLGKSGALRIKAYAALFNAHINQEQLGVIRASCQSGTPLGNNYFKQKVEEKLMCNVGQINRGRPKKGSDPF